MIVVITKKLESELIHLEQQNFPGEQHILTALKSPRLSCTGLSLLTLGSKLGPVVASS